MTAIFIDVLACTQYYWKMDANIGVVTFAGGAPRWYLAGFRLLSQCRKSERDIQAELFTPRKLRKSLDPSIKSFMKANPKGYGYWVWKPFVVTQFLKSNPKIKYVLFLDAGCELKINSKSIQNWDRYLEFLENVDCLTFDNGQIEQNWTKRELIDFLKPSSAQVESNQLAAGVFFMKREFALDFCEKWLALMRENDFFFITDELDTKIQIESFRENRYDQSVFSLLIKNELRNITLSGDKEIFFPGNWESEQTKPIWTTRNGSVVPILSRGIIANSVRLTERIVHFIFQAFARFRRK
jgi:hypothetical protein